MPYRNGFLYHHFICIITVVVVFMPLFNMGYKGKECVGRT